MGSHFGRTTAGTSLLVLSLALVACQDARLDSSVTAISPTSISPFVKQEVIINGSFVAPIVVTARTGETRVDTQFNVWLLPLAPDGASTGTPIPLEEVVWRDSTTLSAWTRPGLSAGDYTLRVEDPRGRNATVDEGVIVEVLKTDPDHVVFLPSDKQWLSTDDKLGLQLQAVDQNSEPYPLSATIAVLVPVDFLNIETSLENETRVEQPDGLIVTGDLSKEGMADFVISCISDEECLTQPLFTLEVSSPGDWPGAATIGTVDVGVVEPYDRLELTLRGGVPGNGTSAVVAGVPLDLSIRSVDSDGGDVAIQGEVLLFDINDRPVGVEGNLYVEEPDCLTSSPVVLAEGLWEGALYCHVAMETNRLFAVGPLQKVGVTSNFTVLPSEATSLSVAVSFDSSSLVAGQPLDILIEPRDVYGNLTQAELSEPFVDDITDSLTCDTPIFSGEQSVEFRDCIITDALQSNVVRADAGELVGVSEPFDVVAGTATMFSFSSVPELVAAGSSLEGTVSLTDSFHNPVSVGSTVITLYDQPDEGQAEFPTGIPFVLLGGTAQFQLSFRVPVGSTRLLASGVAYYRGESEAFAVTPGPAARFEVHLDDEVVSAGDTVVATVTVLDDFGNIATSYSGSHDLVLSSEGTVLEDVSGDGTFFIDGQGEVSFQPTQASSAAYVTLTDEALFLSGSSEPFVVTPDDTIAAYRIEGYSSIVWSERPFGLTIFAEDAFGNLMTSVERSVQMSDRTLTLSCVDPDCSVDSILLKQGVFSGTFMISSVLTRNRISVTDGEVLSTGGSFNVYSLDCTPMQTGELFLGGQNTYAVACENESVGFWAKVADPGSVVDYVWIFGDGTLQGTVRASAEHVYVHRGRYFPALSIVDSALCGSWDEAEVFVGINDGSPTGPLEMMWLDSSDALISGADDGSQVAKVLVQAYDCREDIAGTDDRVESGENPFQLTVVSSLGQFQTGDVAAESSGTQFELSKMTGSVTFNFTAGNERFAGVARILAASLVGGEDGSAEEVALGVLNIPIENDRTQPYVLGVGYEPSTETEGGISRIDVSMSESLRAAGLVFASGEVPQDPTLRPFDVTFVNAAAGGGTTLLRVAESILSDDGRTLSLFLSDAPVPQGDLEWVQLSLYARSGATSVTDVAGNRIDGNYDGIAQGGGLDTFTFLLRSPYLVPGESIGVRCEAAQDAFSPDGQDGLGLEADVFSLDVEIETGAAGLEWINLELEQIEDGSLVSSRFLPLYGATSGMATIFWDGRDLGGQVQPNGAYRYRLHLLTAESTLQESVCEGEVTIANPLDLGAIK